MTDQLPLESLSAGKVKGRLSYISQFQNNNKPCESCAFFFIAADNLQFKNYKMGDIGEDELVFLQETLKSEIDNLQKLYDDAEKSKSFGKKVDPKTVEQDEIHFLNKLQANLKEQPDLFLPDHLDLEHLLELELKETERVEQHLIAENKRLKQEVQE